MRRIEKFEPPSAQQMAELKASLGWNGPQMAKLSGLAHAGKWRKYTGGQDPRAATVQIMFFMAAHLELSDEQLDAIYERMRQLGCVVEQAETDISPRDERSEELC